MVKPGNNSCGQQSKDKERRRRCGTVRSALDKQVFGKNCIGAPKGSLLVKSNGKIVRNVACGREPSDCRWQPARDLSSAQRKALKDAASLWALVQEIEGLRH